MIYTIFHENDISAIDEYLPVYPLYCTCAATAGSEVPEKVLTSSLYSATQIS